MQRGCLLYRLDRLIRFSCAYLIFKHQMPLGKWINIYFILKSGNYFNKLVTLIVLPPDSMSNNSTEEYEIPTYTNYAFAGTYMLCSVLGLPGNIISLHYFIVNGIKVKHVVNKVFFNTLFTMTTLIDMLVCATLLPQIVSFMHQRQGAWYLNKVFCHIWGILWEILPFMSVFLVGLMSISRTLVLIKPLYQLKNNALWSAIIIYSLFLVVRTAVPILLKAATYEYVYSDVYCYELPTADWSYKFNSISRLLTLAAPVIPICISCITSFTIIILNERKQENVKRSSQVRPATCPPSEGKRKSTQTMHATTTILIFTVAYIVFNIPVFINYLLMSIAGWNKNCVSDCYHKTYEDHPALIWYSWNFTYITCVALNSTINPIIYYWRMDTVKSYINKNMRKTSKIISELQPDENPMRRISTVFRNNKICSGKSNGHRTDANQTEDKTDKKLKISAL